MHRLKILIVIDQYGWAFDFAARGIQKYSKHDVTIERYDKISGIWQSYDVIFFMNNSIFRDKKRFITSGKRICVGIRGGLIIQEKGCDRIIQGCDNTVEGCDIACVSKEIYDFLSQKKISRLHLCHNGVDDEIFKPFQRPKDRFVVGWAGNPNSSPKRYYLLGLFGEFGFPVKVMGRWGRQYFIPNRSRQEMIDFYESIDCLICVSDAEGMPQPILEAAATGLPVISTDVGGVPEFLDKEWLIPIQSNPKLQVEEFIKKLRILKENSELRFEVGQRNLQKTLNTWSWKNIVKEYDRMFEGNELSK
jgi:glycosyltransferase involved in cell wall biosynthesis